jgi:hypothetical protein
LHFGNGAGTRRCRRIGEKRHSEDSTSCSEIRRAVAAKKPPLKTREQGVDLFVHLCEGYPVGNESVRVAPTTDFVVDAGHRLDVSALGPTAADGLAQLVDSAPGVRDRSRDLAKQLPPRPT